MTHDMCRIRGGVGAKLYICPSASFFFFFLSVRSIGRTHAFGSLRIGARWGGKQKCISEEERLDQGPCLITHVVVRRKPGAEPSYSTRRPTWVASSCVCGDFFTERSTSLSLSYKIQENAATVDSSLIARLPRSLRFLKNQEKATEDSTGALNAGLTEEGLAGTQTATTVPREARMV